MDETGTLIHLHHRPGTEPVQSGAEAVRVTAFFEPLSQQSGRKTGNEIILPQHQRAFPDLRWGTVLPYGAGNSGKIQ